MRHASHSPRVTLFPFLSVLLSTMGVLAFLSISFLLVVPQDADSLSTPKRIKFEWVGAPGYVKPIFIRCHADRIEYYNLFDNQDYTIMLEELLDQLQGDNPEFLDNLNHRYPTWEADFNVWETYIEELQRWKNRVTKLLTD